MPLCLHAHARILAYLVYSFPHSSWSPRVQRRYRHCVRYLHPSHRLDSDVMRSARVWWQRTVQSSSRWVRQWRAGRDVSRDLEAALVDVQRREYQKQQNAVLVMMSLPITLSQAFP